MLSLHEISTLLLAQRSPDRIRKSEVNIGVLIEAGLMERTRPSDPNSGLKLTEKGRDTLRRLENLRNACESGNGLFACPTDGIMQVERANIAE
jgi:hypothetical protein